MASAIADLLERGTRESGRAYSEELLPQGLRLVQRLLAEVTPTVRGDDADPMFAAINTTKGRTIEVLFAYALRRCRVSDRQMGGHDMVWAEIGSFFDQELARCTGTNYEFSTLAGAYLGNLDYMSPPWVERNLNAIFSADDQAAFVAAVGGLAYSRPSRRIYRLLRRSGILDRALGAELRGREVREKLIERVLLAFLWEEEAIESPRIQFSFVHGIIEDLKAAASFLWMIRGDELTGAQRGRVVEYWVACDDWARAQETLPSELLAALAHLAWALEEVDGKSLELLLAVVPYVRGHNPYELVKELNRLVEVSPAGVGEVFKSMVDTSPPVYDYKDGMKALISALAGAGERGAAIYCANRLIELEGMDRVYQQLIGAE